MGRRSYTPSPPPRGRGRFSGRGRDPSTSLLVRNLRHDCRPEDLRRPFGQFGPLKDIYLPRDYYTGAPRGFGFVQYVDPADAADAKYRMDGQIFQGRELTVVFAEENRKKPTEMRSRERTRGRYDDRRRSSARYSRSPPPRHARSRSLHRDDYSPSPKRREYLRSVSPGDKKVSRGRSYSRESRGRSYSRSPQSPKNSRSRSRSQSPGRSPGPSRSRSKSRSRSPFPEEHRNEQSRDPSPTPSQ